MPDSHPNLDALIANPAAKPLPSWHTPINPWVGRIPQPSYTPYRYACQRSRYALMHRPPALLRRASLPFWHPVITTAYKNNVSAPSWHTEHIQLFSGQLRSVRRSALQQRSTDRGADADIVPDDHPNFTQLIANPAAHPFPAGHPPIEPWIANLSMPSYTPYRRARRRRHCRGAYRPVCLMRHRVRESG
jgi:hypothetical protein